MKPPSRALVASVVYGLLVFLGTALLGFVVAPLLGIALGYFTIPTESQSVFSLLTLKAVPYLVGGSALSGVLYRHFSQRRLLTRAAILLVDIAAVWLVGASLCLWILG